MDIFDVFDLDSQSKRKAPEDEDDGSNVAQEAVKIDNNLIDELMSNSKKVKAANSDEIVDLTEENETADVDKAFAEEVENFMPRVAIHQLETKGNCVHEVVYPLDLEYVALRDLSETANFKPAKEYKFVLDSFQNEAILCIENNQSVLGKIYHFE